MIYATYSPQEPGVEQAMKNCTGGRKISERSFQLPLYSSLPPRIGACPLCPPVEAMHAVTVMGLKAKARPTISVDTVLTSTPADRFVSFYRISVGPQGVKPLKSGRAMTILARPGAQSMIDPVKNFPDIRGPPLGMGSVADPVEIYPPVAAPEIFFWGG